MNLVSSISQDWAERRHQVFFKMNLHQHHSLAGDTPFFTLEYFGHQSFFPLSKSVLRAEF